MLKPSGGFLEKKFSPDRIEKKAMHPAKVSMKFHKLHVKKGPVKKR